jgi:hypothetical protein
VLKHLLARLRVGGLLGQERQWEYATEVAVSHAQYIPESLIAGLVHGSNEVLVLPKDWDVMLYDDTEDG